MGLEINRFVNCDQINEDLICNICKGVLEEGVWAQTCEHAFCKFCINQWLLRKSVCPNDRQPLNHAILKPIPRFMRNLLDKLEIKCDFVANGCQQIFNLDSLRSHVSVCDFNPEKPIECLSGCGLTIRKADIQSHNCVKSLREAMSGNQRGYENEISSIKRDMNSLKSENNRLRALLNGLQNDVKNIVSEKQIQVMSTANSLSQLSNTSLTSASVAHTTIERSSRQSVPNPYVLITPLQSISSTLGSIDEPSSSTLVTSANNRLMNDEPAYKRRTTTIRVANPPQTLHMDQLSSGHTYTVTHRIPFSNVSHNREETIDSRSPSPRYISRERTLSLVSNDSNSGDESIEVTVSESHSQNQSNNYITLEDHDFEDTEETEAEEEPSIGIIDEIIE